MQDVFAGRLFKTRGGAVLIGGVAAVLAAILLIVYLHSYRSSVNAGTRPMQVLVAKSLIPRGTSGSLIAQQHMYQVTNVAKDQLKLLAIADPAALNDRVTLADVYPGQQLTANDFTAEPVNSIPNIITGMSRDFVEEAFPLDGTIELVGVVEGLDEAWLTLQEVPCDLLVVACAGHSEKALVLIDGAVKQRPSRPVVIFGHASPNGFVR